MKRIQFIFCLLLFIQICPLTFAQQGNMCQEDLFPYFDKEKRTWGYADMMGMMVIEPIFTKVSPFSSSKAIVQKGNLCGVIDCNGNLVVPVQYKKILNFRYNKAWAMKDSTWCLIDDKGRMVLQPQFSDIYAISGTELTWVKKNGLWGLFNEEKTAYVCTPQYTVAQVLSPACSLIQKDGKLGVLNHVNCGYLLEPNIENVKKISPQDVLFNQDGKWGIFSNTGRVRLNPIYDSLDVIKSGILIAKLNGKYGLIDFIGSTILPAEYQQIFPYSNGFFRIKKNDLYGFSSVKGKVYITPKYKQANDFVNGSTIVEQNDKFGIINLKDSFIVKPEYSSIMLSKTNEYYIGRKNALQADLILKNKDNSYSVETFNDVLTEDSIASIRVMKNNETYFYNGLLHSYCFDQGFDGAQAFIKGRAVVGDNGLLGIIDQKGTYVVKPVYTDIQVLGLGSTLFYLVRNNTMKGLLDFSGTQILPLEYQEIVVASPNYLKVKKDEFWSLLRANGTVISTQLYSFMSAEDVMPIPVQRSKKWCLLNEKGEETKLVKAISITPKANQRGLYVLDSGKKQITINASGELVK